MSERFDVIIVGGGPAGLAAGLYAARMRLRSVLLDRGPMGGQLLNTELIEDYPGFTSITGHELARKMAEHALAFGAEFVTDALEMALWRRSVEAGSLVAHSDRGSQYTSFAYTDRLHEAGIAPSVGSRGDAFDNAMAESLNGSYKWELVKGRRWKTRSELELATVEWISWYNHTRLHGEIGDVPPAEFEARWRSKTGEPMLARPKSG